MISIVAQPVRRVICILFAAAALAVSTTPANAQSALRTQAGMGYGTLGYVADIDGVEGVELLHGPQMDFGVMLGLGSIFSVGLDADLTIVDAGQRIDGLDEYDVTQVFDVMNADDAETIQGAVVSGAALVGVQIGPYTPSVGVGFVQAEVDSQDRGAIRDFNCATFVAKPVELRFNDLASVSMEYEQAIPGCDVDFSGLTLSAQISF